MPGTPHPPGHIQLLPRPSGTLSPSTPHMLSPTAGNPNINASRFFSKMTETNIFIRVDDLGLYRYLLLSQFVGLTCQNS